MSLAKVQGIKESLSKHLPLPIEDDKDVEACQDMLDQLEKCQITLDILTKTLIGTIVSKFKLHESLGPTAKTLVKRWKKVAKEASAETSKSTAKPPPKAAASKPAPAQRRESTASVSSDAAAAMEEEWGGMQPYRKNACHKLHASLSLAKPDLIKDGINSNAVDMLLVTRVTETEEAMNKQFSNDKTGYAGKARSLCFNLKQNTSLGGRVVLGQISASDLVSLTPEELASDDKRQQMQERTQKLLDTKRLDWEQANESKINEMCGIKGDLLNASLFTCGRCKSTKTTSTQKQTRSADEPMTVFVLCLNCGKRWKC